jgi:ribosomal protein S16
MLTGENRSTGGGRQTESLGKFRDKDGNSRKHIQRVEGDRLKVWINLGVKMVTGENRSGGWRETD